MNSTACRWPRKSYPRISDVEGALGAVLTDPYIIVVSPVVPEAGLIAWRDSSTAADTGTAVATSPLNILEGSLAFIQQNTYESYRLKLLTTTSAKIVSRTDAAPNAKNATAPTADTAMTVSGFTALSVVEGTEGLAYEGRGDGYEVGHDVGRRDGTADSAGDADEKGLIVGCDVGFDVGCKVGNHEGFAVGLNDGFGVGFTVGILVGALGLTVGCTVGEVGSSDGCAVGNKTSGQLGAGVGCDVGVIERPRGSDSLDGCRVWLELGVGYGVGNHVGFGVGLSEGFVVGFAVGFAVPSTPHAQNMVPSRSQRNTRYPRPFIFTISGYLLLTCNAGKLQLQL
jgi:hypothetical protein